MKQYYAIKAENPDAILLFRVGDFYETFGEDAIRASGILGITLTRRANGAASFVELAGFPHHALDTYLPRLVRAGQRVAICEQLEDPRATKKIVKRGITELVTPGLTFHENVLENKENNFLASVYYDRQLHGIAFLDISTGEFLCSQGDRAFIDKLLNNFAPREVLVQRKHLEAFQETFGDQYFLFPLDDWVYTDDNAHEKLQRQFGTQTLKGFGIQDMGHGILASGAVLQYLDITRHAQTAHISRLSRIERDHYVWLDRFTIRNLEIFQSLYEGASTLVDVMDKTVTPMGSRLLKRWLSLPLKDVLLIRERHNMVECMAADVDFMEALETQIREVGDLERVISKLAAQRINPREMLQLMRALRALEPLKEVCIGSGEESMIKLADQLKPCEEERDRIAFTLSDEPPALLNKGGIIGEGVSAELDELREIMHTGKDYLVKLQEQEMERTAISSLKIGFNNVFGYYMEVRNTHKDKVPPEWIRKQTLVSAERYITEELKSYEEKILGAEEKSLALEASLYAELIQAILGSVETIQQNASLVARLDCLLSFAKAAVEYDYCRPEVDESTLIDIKDGRHPVIERQLPIDESYISNDVKLNNKDQQIIILTGPNMSGKSAFLRQTALITLMAQVGSFVPASSARIGWVDKIFTRVGASDNISLGESTFMVEMLEAASILNNLSERSLVILDEIGRGTSTYDGISIAWAMVEYIHEHAGGSAKTVFATHYHELNQMEASFPRIRNYNVSIRELDDRVIFLRKLIPGGSEHSFGIHVAQMAGMPASVVKRANDILRTLERKGDDQGMAKPVDVIADQREGLQMSFFQLDDPVLTQIRDQIAGLDINNLTPVEALNKLNEIKKLSGL